MWLVWLDGEDNFNFQCEVWTNYKNESCRCWTMKTGRQIWRRVDTQVSTGSYVHLLVCALAMRMLPDLQIMLCGQKPRRNVCPHSLIRHLSVSTVRG